MLRYYTTLLLLYNIDSTCVNNLLECAFRGTRLAEEFVARTVDEFFGDDHPFPDLTNIAGIHL